MSFHACAHAMARTRDEMIVHHPGCLHERIADRRSDEFESASQQVLAHGIALRGARGNLFHLAKAVYARLSTDEIPDVAIERPEFALHVAKRLRVRDRGMNLQPIPYNARVQHELRGLWLRETRNFGDIEVRKRSSVSVPLRED